MVPWIRLMRSHDLKPRCLADDLLITSRGERYIHKCTTGVCASLAYFEDIGAKVAESKCFTFAGDQGSRAFLKTFTWDSNGTQIPVRNNFRDLGTHLNLTDATIGTTTTKRMLIARQMAQRLRWLPLSQVEKESYVRSNINPAALYGVEATRVSNTSLQSLRSAIARAIGPRSSRRSLGMTFSCTSCANDLDPAVQILVRRVLTVRRIMSKHNGQHGLVRLIIRHYQKPGQSSPIVPQGPIGLLVQELRAMGADIDDNLRITQPSEAAIDLWHIPWQHLQKAVAQIAVRHRTRQEASSRQHLAGLTEIDEPILRSCINKLGGIEKKIITHIATGGAWGEQQLHEIGRGQMSVCRICE